jgi:hypothetical protein
MNSVAHGRTSKKETCGGGARCRIGTKSKMYDERGRGHDTRTHFCFEKHCSAISHIPKHPQRLWITRAETNSDAVPQCFDSAWFPYTVLRVPGSSSLGACTIQVKTLGTRYFLFSYTLQNPVEVRSLTINTAPRVSSKSP